jgi:hypothetical protein
MTRKKPHSYAINAGLASAVLYFVLDLSASDRGVVDYAVIGAVCLAILWNVVQLSRRLYSAGGRKDVWHVQRTVLFWVIGLLNTVFARPELVGGWRTWLGGALLVMAAADTVALFLKERKVMRPPAEGPAHGDAVGSAS